MSEIVLKDIEKVYDNGFHAVHNFNMEIKDKEFIVFVGPSGCGKSTTLRMIAGLEEITRGTLTINGKVVNALPPKERGIAMVFQSYALYPHLTVRENLAFGLKLAGFDEDEIEERVEETSKIMGLEEYLERKPKNLSGGQRQRVALGRAVIRHADVFLMDEPLSNLDAKMRVSMRSELVRIHRKVGATTIYVTHDQIEAMTMASRIVCMKLGRIQQIGTPEELYFKPRNLFVARFIGDPQMNIVSGKIINGVFTPKNCPEAKIELGNKAKAFEEKVKDRDIVLGFRPESISLEEKPHFVEMNGVVEITEMLGDTMNIYVNVGKENEEYVIDENEKDEDIIKADSPVANIIIRTVPSDKYNIGDSIKFYIDLDNLHIFYRDSKLSIDAE